MLTSGCNLSCSYCYQDRQLPTARIEWGTLRKAIALLLASKHEEVSLGFCGGEPLLEVGMIRRAVDYVEANRRPDQKVIYALVTNGTLLDEETANFLTKHRFQTHLSFDGIAAAQNLRQQGSFRRLDNLVNRLREEAPEFFNRNLTISITVLPSTLCHLKESIRYFYTKDVRGIRLSPLSTDCSDWSTGSLPELDSVFSELCELSLAHYAATGRVPLSEFAKRIRSGDPTPSTRNVCRVGQCRSLAVDADGQLYGCILFAESAQRFPSFLAERVRTLRLGHLGDSGLAERVAGYPAAVSATEIFDHLELKYSSYGRCGECEYLVTCEICPLSIGYIPGNTDPNRVPDFLCAFNRVTQKYREIFQRRAVSNGIRSAVETLRASHIRLEETVASLQSDIEH